MEGGEKRELGLESVCSDMRKTPPTAPHISIFETPRGREKNQLKHTKTAEEAMRLTEMQKEKWKVVFLGGSKKRLFDSRVSLEKQREN